MTPDEARELIIEGMNYAAYKETDSSLHDADKNRLFGSDHLLRLANVLNSSIPAFKEAQTLLEDENSILLTGHKARQTTGLARFIDRELSRRVCF